MKLSPAPSQRDLLIETGTRLFHELGYAATGVRQVAAAAGVPQGSFTNHFRSKESFGLAVLDNYTTKLGQLMDVTLRDTRRSPVARVEAYFDAVEKGLRAGKWGVGCLIPDLAAEAPVLPEQLRAAVASVLERQTSAFTVALQDIRQTSSANDDARILLAAWQGTLLRMKVEKSDLPLKRFRIVLQRVLHLNV